MVKVVMVLSGFGYRVKLEGSISTHWVIRGGSSPFFDSPMGGVRLTDGLAEHSADKPLLLQAAHLLVKGGGGGLPPPTALVHLPKLHLSSGSEAVKE